MKTITQFYSFIFLLFICLQTKINAQKHYEELGLWAHVPVAQPLSWQTSMRDGGVVLQANGKKLLVKRHIVAFEVWLSSSAICGTVSEANSANDSACGRLPKSKNAHPSETWRSYLMMHHRTDAQIWRANLAMGERFWRAHWHPPPSGDREGESDHLQRAALRSCRPQTKEAERVCAVCSGSVLQVRRDQTAISGAKS